MDSEQSLKVKVSEHAVQIAIMSENVTDIKDTMKRNHSALSNIAVILEKLTNIENNDIQSKNRIHVLIDKLDSRHVSLVKRVEIAEMTLSNIEIAVKKTSEHVEEMTPIRMILRYPKLATVTIAASYLLTIKEIRDVVFKLGGH